MEISINVYNTFNISFAYMPFQGAKPITETYTHMKYWGITKQFDYEYMTHYPTRGGFVFKPEEAKERDCFLCTFVSVVFICYR